MALKKEIRQTTPDNGVRGNYWRLVGIQTPQFDFATGWSKGALTFDVYQKKQDRDNGLAPMTPYTIVVPPAFFYEMKIFPDRDATVAAIYLLKSMIPGLEDAEDI